MLNRQRPTSLDLNQMGGPRYGNQLPMQPGQQMMPGNYL